MIKRARISFLIVVLLLSFNFTSCAIFKAFKKNPAQIGELVPCSARVAKKITELINPQISPKRIIEVGAGSGALTGKIISKMQRFDHLDLVEIDPLLCDVLKEKFGHLENVSVHCMDFLKYKPHYQYDYIVSTLPFNSFSPELLQKFIDHFINIAKNGAILGFVEFKWLSSFRTIGMNKKEKENLKKTREMIKNFRTKYGLYDISVYMNFPPINVYLLKIDKSKK